MSDDQTQNETPTPQPSGRINIADLTGLSYDELYAQNAALRDAMDLVRIENTRLKYENSIHRRKIRNQRKSLRSIQTAHLLTLRQTPDPNWKLAALAMAKIINAADLTTQDATGKLVIGE